MNCQQKSKKCQNSLYNFISCNVSNSSKNFLSCLVSTHEYMLFPPINLIVTKIEGTEKAVLTPNTDRPLQSIIHEGAK